jgi:hypothetical protein
MRCRPGARSVGVRGQQKYARHSGGRKQDDAPEFNLFLIPDFIGNFRKAFQ